MLESMSSGILTRVVFEKVFHLLLVAGDNEDELADVVLHLRKEEVENGVTAAVLWAHKLVGFVDKHGTTT